MVEFKGDLRATGFGDKLRWAVYDAEKYRIRSPIKGDAAEREGINKITRYGFSPYLEPSEDGVEVQYCRQVVKWWKAVQGLNRQSLRPPPIRREHLLISEASPNRAPQGFFDCTVEVRTTGKWSLIALTLLIKILQKFENDGGPTIVYVTDYTINTGLQPVQDAWCPHGLSNSVLHCDMWDSAKSIARAMKPGEYWYLHNVRAKWSHRHSIEATMQLAEKITRLDEAMMEAQPNLKALLT